jgi:SHS2 domain-containing protein
MSADPYEFFEHTADIGVRARAATLPELFVNAARAMYEAMGAFQIRDRAAPRHLQLQAESLEDLLHDWLAELLFELETRHRYYDRIEIAELTGQHLDARLQGGTIAWDRSQTNEEIKAVTYHKLKVEQTSDGHWCATIIFDV